MEADTAGVKNNMLDAFDEIFYKHLERLIGSKYGIEELSLNSVTLSLIIMLMERENEIQSFPSDEIDRYKNETLISDLEEMGFDADQDMNIAVEEMIRKDYIHIDDGRLIPQKPLISMARLIDLAFPNMPGTNLLAYLVQTMDEVKSMRKDLDSATSQLDQVLQMQGVPLKKGSQQPETSKLFARSDDKGIHVHKSDKSRKINQEISSEKNLKTPAILNRQSSDNLSDYSKSSFDAPKVLSSDAYKGKVKIRKVDFGEHDLKDVEPDLKSSDEHGHVENEEPETREKRVEGPLHDAADIESSDEGVMTSSEESTKIVFDDQIPIMDSVDTRVSILDSDTLKKDASYDLKSVEQDKSIFDDIKEDSPKTNQFQEHIENVKETLEGDPGAPSVTEDSSVNDVDVEKRIAAFEEDLALECPICRDSKVLAEKTAMGKSYYKCSNKACNFISWGKPHHIPCPKCNNPFLIEATNKAGKTILKCPRATCRYWKKALPDTADNYQKSIESASEKTKEITSISRKPRRRVVRRRVVRKKK